MLNLPGRIFTSFAYGVQVFSFVDARLQFKNELLCLGNRQVYMHLRPATALFDVAGGYGQARRRMLDLQPITNPAGLGPIHILR